MIKIAVFKKVYSRLRKAIKKEAQKETAEAIGGEDIENENAITSIRAAAPPWKGLKRKYIYVLLGALCLLIAGAVYFGLAGDKKAEQEREARKLTELKDSRAVTGDHLLNIPKDYEAQAEAERRKKAEAEKLKRAESAGSEGTKPAAAEVPATPQLPRQYYHNRDNAADKAEQRKADARRKAFESPIGFEIKGVVK